MKKAIVIYESTYGNTERVAHAIAGALASEGAVETKRIGEVSMETLGSFDLLVIGSPTQGFRPTKTVTDFLKRLGTRGLTGVKAAAFDTRFDATKLESRALTLLVKTGGYAAPRMAKGLTKAGGAVVLPPEGFYVEDTEGPLRAGELDRAAVWAREVLQATQFGCQDEPI
jgi:flavodoxin I